MPQIIASSAQMQCDKGASLAPLSVTSQDFVTIEDNAIATEKDNQAITNIPSFGYCTTMRKNCNPSPQQWQQTCKEDSINDMKELTMSSYCMCTQGGKITFVDSGQSGFVTGE